MEENVYKITNDTLIIQSLSKKQVKIIELNSEILENINHIRMIQDSCIYYGSTYEGRIKSAKKILKIYRKIPIIISEKHNLLFFPICSTRLVNCIWISYNNLEKYKPLFNKTRLYFTNNFYYDVDFSYNIIHNQVIKCMLLEKNLEKK